MKEQQVLNSSRQGTNKGTAAVDHHVQETNEGTATVDLQYPRN